MFTVVAMPEPKILAPRPLWLQPLRWTLLHTF